MAKAYEEQNTPGTTLPAPLNKRTSDLLKAIERVSKIKGYLLFKNPGEVNIWYIEGMNTDCTPNDNAPNKFNDVRLVFSYEDKRPVIRGIWDATTEPGRYWTLNPMNPKGAARIKFGQYKAWVTGIYHNYEALIQSSPITVYRDLNKDFVRTGDKEDTGMFGVHHHWGYDLSKDDLGTSSAGCLVGRSTKGHKEFMVICKSDPRWIGNPTFEFTATVIPYKDLNL